MEVREVGAEPRVAARRRGVEQRPAFPVDAGERVFGSARSSATATPPRDLDEARVRVREEVVRAPPEREQRRARGRRLQPNGA